MGKERSLVRAINRKTSRKLGRFALDVVTLEEGYWNGTIEAAYHDQTTRDLFAGRDLVIAQVAKKILKRTMDDQLLNPRLPSEVIHHMKKEGRLSESLVREFLLQIGIIDHP